MSNPLPCPSASAGSGESFVASSSKLSASHQHQVQRARLLAVVDQSRAPINKSSDYDPTAPATPSARTISSITGLSLIPELPPLVEQVLGKAHVPGGGGRHRGSSCLTRAWRAERASRQGETGQTPWRGGMENPFAL
jgi:hypothetical protein